MWPFKRRKHQPKERPNSSWKNEFRNSGDQLRNHYFRELFDLGYEITTKVRSMTDADLGQSVDRAQRRFASDSNKWIEQNLSKEMRKKVKEIQQSKNSDGFGPSATFNRPFAFTALAGWDFTTEDDARRLNDRGVEVSRNPIDIHLTRLKAIEFEMKFSRALDPIAIERLRKLVPDLIAGRPAARREMVSRWGEAAPNMGETYDPIEFLIAGRAVSYTYWTRKDDPSAEDRSLELSWAMVARSKEFIAHFKTLKRDLPDHDGFNRLVITLEKRKEYHEALDLSRRAQHEGWQGDWDKRIDRLTTKISKIRTA